MIDGKIVIIPGCLGTTCRSPVIFGIVRHELAQLGIPAVVRAVGIIDDLKTPMKERPVHLQTAQAHSIAACAAMGIDITDHEPAHMETIFAEFVDLVISADPKANLEHVAYFGANKVVLLNAPDGVYNPFDDTLADKTKQDPAKYAKMAAQIKALMPSLMRERIIPLAREKGLLRAA